MHILLWFGLAAGEGAMNFLLSQKWRPPPPPHPLVLFPSPSFLSLSLSRLKSFMSVVLPLSRTLCFLLPVLALILILLVLRSYILHNGFSLASTSPSSSMSALTSSNASRELVSITFQALCQCGYLCGMTVTFRDRESTRYRSRTRIQSERLSKMYSFHNVAPIWTQKFFCCLLSTHCFSWGSLQIHNLKCAHFCRAS